MTPGEYPEYSKELIIEFDELMGTASAQSNVQKVEELFDNFGKTMDTIIKAAREGVRSCVDASFPPS